MTLNFTANGGDGYPVKANGENFRYLLDDGTLSGPVDEALDFTAPANVPANALGEQQALAEFCRIPRTPATAFDEADTPISGDTRIQNLNFRDDAVFDSPPIVGNEDDNVIVGTVGNDDIDATLGVRRSRRCARGDDKVLGGMATTSSKAATARTSSTVVTMTTSSSATTATTRSRRLGRRPAARQRRQRRSS